MCNIAGYIGNRPAAPILLEMMAKESGFGGGYYKGIATLHEGKLYYAKVAGDMDRLLGETNAASLPGNIGFIHSRSFGRQNMEWAHPFISDRGRLAYIANGFNGVFENLELFNSYCKQMLDEGFTFRTATTENIGYNTPRLSDGSGIHGSELAAHMITSEYRKEKDFGLAMMKSMVKRPTEIVGLALHEDFEDTIFISRFNFPMMTARAE
ncbi:MAG: hypothetical protein GX633_01430, partial [Clostridiales bacterium]|nr:hypothetical protein [Clostridiales bacterium]